MDTAGVFSGIAAASAVVAWLLRGPTMGNKADLPNLRVAVIGGGIAGVGAAWSLHKAGCKNVHIFEKNPAVGGNARVFEWPSNPPVTSGLSVLAWPEAYFHNYKAILKETKTATTTVTLRFFIKEKELGTFVHGRTSDMREHFKGDLARWNTLVSFVRKVNRFFHGPTPKLTLYAMSLLNPLNVISLRRLSQLFFVSSSFWDCVVVPIHSSSFLTTHLDGVPAVIAPILDDMISFEQPAVMDSWTENSSLVFQKLVEGIHVHTNCPIKRISFAEDASILVRTESGVLEFDRVIFACNADAAAAALEGSSALERFLLNSTSYADDNDVAFLDGRIHSDASVIPAEYRAEVLRSCSNYCEVSHGNVENTFVLSSWVPAVQAAGITLPMLVTYNSTKPVDRVLGTVCNARCHPEMTLANTIIKVLLRCIQGRRGVYYCGSFATPGNGHDLSLLSGFVAAHALGAPHPFPENAEAAEDFGRLRHIMGL